MTLDANNLHYEASALTIEDRHSRAGGSPFTVWLTGYSGAGKSSISRLLEKKLFDFGRFVYRLDGDNLRHGLNKDLSFTDQDRSENIRRVAEVAKLFNDAGIVVVCSFISPLIKDRENARNIIGSNNFFEVYLSTALHVCEARDPHGLYKLARKGKIKNFTGIDSIYEKPTNPDLILDTAQLSITESVDKCLQSLFNSEKRCSYA